MPAVSGPFACIPPRCCHGHRLLIRPERESISHSRSSARSYTNALRTSGCAAAESCDSLQRAARMYLDVYHSRPDRYVKSPHSVNIGHEQTRGLTREGPAHKAEKLAHALAALPTLPLRSTMKPIVNDACNSTKERRGEKDPARPAAQKPAAALTAKEALRKARQKASKASKRKC